MRFIYDLWVFIVNREGVLKVTEYTSKVLLSRNGCKVVTL